MRCDLACAAGAAFGGCIRKNRSKGPGRVDVGMKDLKEFVLFSVRIDHRMSASVLESTCQDQASFDIYKCKILHFFPFVL